MLSSCVIFVLRCAGVSWQEGTMGDVIFLYLILKYVAVLRGEGFLCVYVCVGRRLGV